MFRKPLPGTPAFRIGPKTTKWRRYKSNFRSRCLPIKVVGAIAIGYDPDPSLKAPLSWRTVWVHGLAEDLRGKGAPVRACFRVWVRLRWR